MFHWKGYCFQVSVIGSAKNKLEVKWFCNSSATSESTCNIDDEEQCSQLDSNEILPHSYSSALPEFTMQKQSLPSEVFTDVLSLGKYNKGKVLKTGFSFDHTAMCRVPVILTKLKNIFKNVANKKPQHLSCSPQVGASHVGLLLIGVNEIKGLSETSKGFSLVPLRLFSSPDMCDSIMRNLQNLRFISDYGLFSVGVTADNALTFDISFGRHNVGPDVSKQTFHCNDLGKSTISKQDVILMDVCNSFTNKMFVAVIQWTDPHSDTRCRAYLFQNLCNTKYKMIRLKIDELLPSQFEQIAEKITVKSLSVTPLSPYITSSHVLVSTTTKYMLEFLNGKLTQCAPITDGINNIQNQKMTTEKSIEMDTNSKANDVITALMQQNKKCLMDTIALEQSIKCKNGFILHILQQHSSSQNNDKNEALNPPLVPITHYQPRCHFNNVSPHAQRHWDVKRLWKRTIHSRLVCGVDLVKLSQSDNICDIYLVLVPINPCQTTTQSKSSLVHQRSYHHLLSSSSSQETFNLLSPETSLPPPIKKACKNSVLASSSSKVPFASLTVTGFLNTEDYWGCEDICVQVYFVYTVLKDKEEPGSIATRDRHKIDCGRVSFSQAEKLQEEGDLRSSMRRLHEQKGVLDADDLNALGCVQSSLDLRITSVLNPVSSLFENVKSHPSMTFVPKGDQYIYSSDHQRLQLCRLKWLRQLDSRTAVIRVFSVNQDGLLLFIEFLNSISPSDMYIHIEGTKDPKSHYAQSMIVIEETMCGKVEQSLLQLNNSLEKIAVTIPSVKVSNNDDVVDVEIFPDLPSPKFHKSVIVNANANSDEPNCGTSGVGGMPSLSSKGSEKNKKSTISQDDFCVFGVGFAGKGKKGLGMKKSSSKKLNK